MMSNPTLYKETHNSLTYCDKKGQHTHKGERDVMTSAKHYIGVIHLSILVHAHYITNNT